MQNFGFLAVLAVLFSCAAAEIKITLLNDPSRQATMEITRPAPEPFPTLLLTKFILPQTNNLYKFETYLAPGDLNIGTFFGVQYEVRPDDYGRQSGHGEAWKEIKDFFIPQQVEGASTAEEVVVEEEEEKGGKGSEYKVAIMPQNYDRSNRRLTATIAALESLTGKIYYKQVEMPCMVTRGSGIFCEDKMIELNEGI